MASAAVSSSVTRLSSLKESKLTAHEGVNYHCDQCEYKSSTPDNLKIHKQGVHDDDKHSCDQCQYRGTIKGNIETHNISVQCEYKCLKDYLKFYIMSVHKDVKYYCDQCKYQATKKSTSIRLTIACFYLWNGKERSDGYSTRWQKDTKE